MNLLRLASRVASASCAQCSAPSGPGKAELRPYGPGGSLICYGCMTGDPALEETAKESFMDSLDSISGPAILTPDGPVQLLAVAARVASKA